MVLFNLSKLCFTSAIFLVFVFIDASHCLERDSRTCTESIAPYFPIQNLDLDKVPWISSRRSIVVFYNLYDYFILSSYSVNGLLSQLDGKIAPTYAPPVISAAPAKPILSNKTPLTLTSFLSISNTNLVRRLWYHNSFKTLVDFTGYVSLLRITSHLQTTELRKLHQDGQPIGIMSFLIIFQVGN